MHTVKPYSYSVQYVEHTTVKKSYFYLTSLVHMLQAVFTTL